MWYRFLNGVSSLNEFLFLAQAEGGEDPNAKQNRSSDVSNIDFFESPEDKDPTTAYSIYIVLALIIISVVAWAMYRNKRENWRLRGVPADTAATMEMLIDANDLSKAEVYALQKMCHDLGETNPLLPFVSPSLFERYESQVDANIRGALLAAKEKLMR